MAISPDTIDQVRLATDIVELVREYIPTLKKSGRNWKSVCPFHNEKSPSFMVSTEKGIFHCFGCHAGGDVFKFVMLMDNLSWPEAITKLAARVGITVKESTEDIIKRSDKQKLYDLLEDAAAFYNRCLKETKDGSLILKYLKNRGVSDKSIDEFQIGFAPYGSLLSAAAKKGFTNDHLIAAGLMTKTERGSLYEYMSGRLVFPIQDSQGRVVAFGGRTMKDEQPKYLNTPDTKVYSKSLHLYGLYNAIPGLRHSKEVIILEGYMDVVLTHQLGITNTVATLGTALTVQHAKLLGRYAENVTLLFDPDAAGELAARRAIEVFLETDMSVNIATLPDGLDPDEYVLKEKKEGFEVYIAKNAKTPVEYLVQGSLKKWKDNKADYKVKVAQDIIPLLCKVKNEILRMEWVKYLADKIGTTETAIIGEVNKVLKGDRSARTRQDKLEPSKAAAQTIIRQPEDEMLQIIFVSPDLVSMLKESDFSLAKNKKVFELMSKGTIVSDIVNKIDEADVPWFTELMLEEKNFDFPDQVLSGILKDIKIRALKVQRQKLETEVVQMFDGKIPMDDEKVQMYHELSKQLKGSVKN